MKYNFTQSLTADDIVSVLGLTNIKSTDIKISRIGDMIEIDFGDVTLTAEQEHTLKSILKSFGWK
jgi:hypothetical protein